MCGADKGDQWEQAAPICRTRFGRFRMACMAGTLTLEKAFKNHHGGTEFTEKTFSQKAIRIAFFSEFSVSPWFILLLRSQRPCSAARKTSGAGRASATGG